MLLETIDWPELMAIPEACVLDVRAPKEFAEDHCPGAHSLPLFDDDQRSMVGLLYAKEGGRKAFEVASGLIRERIAWLAEEVKAIVGDASDSQAELTYERVLAALTKGAPEPELETVPYDPRAAKGRRTVFVNCWRGGMRSRAFTLFLSALGYHAVQVKEGYKGYRRQVLSALENPQLPHFFVLGGMTGASKTAVLRSLQARMPHEILDLEGLAGHRSSILGDVGLVQSTKKSFDSKILAWLRAGPRKFVLVEGESRKVGDVEIPLSIWQAMRSGTQILAHCADDIRARRLVAEYVRPDRRQDIRKRLEFIGKRLGRKARAQMLADFGNHDDQSVALLLLERYYDPLYKHSSRDLQYAFTVDTADIEGAADELATWIESRIG